MRPDGGACFIHTHKGLHVVIAFASRIGSPDCLSQFNAADCFESVDTQIAGLGEIGDIQQLYVDHAGAAIDSLNG